jgi:hypothetical protein
MGMSNIDIYTGKSACFEIESELNPRHNQTTYDELERFVSSFRPSEVIKKIAAVSYLIIKGLVAITAIKKTVETNLKRH